MRHAKRRIRSSINFSVASWVVYVGALLAHRRLVALCPSGLARLIITAHSPTPSAGNRAAVYEACSQAGLRPVKNSLKGALLTSNPEFSRPCRSAFIWLSTRRMVGCLSGPPLNPLSQPWYFQSIR